jgi:hypothetical protein
MQCFLELQLRPKDRHETGIFIVLLDRKTDRGKKEPKCALAWEQRTVAEFDHK